MLQPLVELCWAQKPRDRPSFAEVVERPELAAAEQAQRGGTSGQDDAHLAEKVNAGLAMMQQVLKGQQDMRSDLKALRQLSEAQFETLSTLMQGADKLAPKLICFLPAVECKQQGTLKAWLGKLRQPKDWFNQRVRIFFIDPVTLALAQTNPDGDCNGQGFELVFPKAWVAKAMPYVKLGLTVLKVAAVAGKLGGIRRYNHAAVAYTENVARSVKYMEEVRASGRAACPLM